MVVKDAAAAEQSGWFWTYHLDSLEVCSQSGNACASASAPTWVTYQELIPGVACYVPLLPAAHILKVEAAEGGAALATARLKERRDLWAAMGKRSSSASGGTHKPKTQLRACTLRSPAACCVDPQGRGRRGRSSACDSATQRARGLVGGHGQAQQRRELQRSCSRAQDTADVLTQCLLRRSSRWRLQRVVQRL